MFCASWRVWFEFELEFHWKDFEEGGKCWDIETFSGGPQRGRGERKIAGGRNDFNVIFVTNIHSMNQNDHYRHFCLLKNDSSYKLFFWKYMNYYDNILLIIQGGFAQFRFSFYLNKHFLHCKSLLLFKIFTNIWMQI